MCNSVQTLMWFLFPGEAIFGNPLGFLTQTNTVVWLQTAFFENHPKTLCNSSVICNLSESLKSIIVVWLLYIVLTTGDWSMSLYCFKVHTIDRDWVDQVFGWWFSNLSGTTYNSNGKSARQEWQTPSYRWVGEGYSSQRLHKLMGFKRACSESSEFASKSSSLSSLFSS
jgi:hypothetical protein